jgi:hypothetical protein
MPTQTKFICPSGGSNIELSGIFAELDGGTSYGSATNFKVASSDINTLFHASTSAEDRPSFDTGFKVNGNDLSTIFRRRGYSAGTSPSITSFLINGDAASGSYDFDDEDEITLSVTASGTPTLSYQWYKNNVIISGATSTSYTFSVSSLNNGDYKCVVTNSFGSATTSTITIVRFYQNSISTQPTNQTVNSGDNATFTISATGNSEPTYQWQEYIGGTWTNISGATSSSYIFDSTAPEDHDKQFRCKVNNLRADGSTPWSETTSNTVTLTVHYIPTFASFDPASGGSYANGDSLSITHTGNDGNATITARLWYYWNGSTYISSGETGTVYSLGDGSYPGTPDDLGGDLYRYYYTIRLTNSVGSTDPQDDSNFGWYVDIQF